MKHRIEGGGGEENKWNANCSRMESKRKSKSSKKLKSELGRFF